MWDDDPLTPLKNSLKSDIFFSYNAIHANFQLYLHLQNFNKFVSDKRNMALSYWGEDITCEGGFIWIGVGQYWLSPCESGKRISTKCTPARVRIYSKVIRDRLRETRLKSKRNNFLYFMLTYDKLKFYFQKSIIIFAASTYNCLLL